MLDANKTICLFFFCLTVPIIQQSSSKDLSMLDLGIQLVSDGGISVEGKILPPPEYLRDDIEYFPPDDDCDFRKTPCK